MIIMAALPKDQKVCKIPALFTTQLIPITLVPWSKKRGKKLSRLKNARESRGFWGNHLNGHTGTCAVDGTCGQRNSLG
jgi:hypothetical protein